MSEKLKKRFALITPFFMCLFPAYTGYIKSAASLEHTALMYCIFLLVFIFMSAVTYAAYYYDKRQARLNQWRVPEKNLHFLSVFGGWPGAIYAQEKFRHKTSKQSFQLVFWLTITINLVGIVYLFVWHLPNA